MPPRPRLPWKFGIFESTAQRVAYQVRCHVGILTRRGEDVTTDAICACFGEEWTQEPRRTQMKRLIWREVEAGRLKTFGRGLYRLPDADEPVPPTKSALKRRMQYRTLWRVLAAAGGALKPADFKRALRAENPYRPMVNGVREGVERGHGVYPFHWTRMIAPATEEGFLLDDYSYDEPRRTKASHTPPRGYTGVWDPRMVNLIPILRLPDRLLEDIPLSGFTTHHMLKARLRGTRWEKNWLERKERAFRDIGRALEDGRRAAGLSRKQVMEDRVFRGWIEDMCVKTRGEDQDRLILKGGDYVGDAIKRRLRQEGFRLPEDYPAYRNPPGFERGSDRSRALRQSIFVPTPVGYTGFQAQRVWALLALIEEGAPLCHYYLPVGLLGYFAKLYNLDLHALSRGATVPRRPGDNAEIDYDGIDRLVESVMSDWDTFSPQEGRMIASERKRRPMKEAVTRTE